MKDKMTLTISERFRMNTENVRITGHTDAGEKQTFYIRGENAWWFENFLKVGTQITLRARETYEIEIGTQENLVRIPRENTLKVEKADTE